MAAEPIAHPPQADGWQQTAGHTAWANAHVAVEEIECVTPTRDAALKWTVVHRKPAVAVAARTADGRFLMVRQERVPTRSTQWEFVAGQIDDPDRADDPAAIRETLALELEEEAGHRLADDAELIPLGYYFTSLGYSDERIHLFAAGPAVPCEGGTRPEENESILECRAFTSAELSTMIASGEIHDSVGLALFARMTACGIIAVR